MRFYQKMICAVVAASASAAAFAKIDDSVAGSGSGELFWSVIDLDGERSYTRDLGVTLTDFLAGVAAGQSWSIANDATLTSFVAGTANASTLVWNIGALDGTGVNRYLSTYTGDPGSLPTYNNTAIRSFNDNSDIFLANVNDLGTHASVANGSSIATVADGSAYAASAVWGGNFGGKATGLSNYVGIADAASLLLIQASTASGSNLAAGSVSQLKFGTMPYTVAFDGAALNITPVPEPGTYALMGLGLAALGIAARRRRQG